MPSKKCTAHTYNAASSPRKYKSVTHNREPQSPISLALLLPNGRADEKNANLLAAASCSSRHQLCHSSVQSMTAGYRVELQKFPFLHSLCEIGLEWRLWPCHTGCVLPRKNLYCYLPFNLAVHSSESCAMVMTMRYGVTAWLRLCCSLLLLTC